MLHHDSRTLTRELLEHSLVMPFVAIGWIALAMATDMHIRFRKYFENNNIIVLRAVVSIEVGTGGFLGFL